ncbi:MAG: dTDP-4-dehydrorhamnose 3,5-epimerase [Ignavibacteriae bacterium]|nr:MAG: dTDP-4-dehydrorhamnose 3,5-epimerase [Ignavibacteriota bacterium]
MNIVETELKGVLILKPDVFKDDRGYFLEAYNCKRYGEFGIPDNFVQDNISRSIKGTIRGLHYQVGEFAQGKLCEVLYGKVKDVAVDLRKSSPTFGKYTAAILSDENHHQIWIPEGFAHGFSVLSDEAIFHYKCTNFYSKEHERAIFYADPDIAIDWETDTPLVSPKDLQAKFFKDIGLDIF